FLRPTSAPCPGPCRCYQNLVDCEHRWLLHVPAMVPHGTWLLDLSGNHLKEVHSRSFLGLWSLRILLMSNNSLHTLHPQVEKPHLFPLTPLRKLTLLSLRGNQLTHVKFKTLLKLQTTSTHLHMSSNPWFCDCELQRVFGKIRRVRHLHVDDYEDVVCHAPAQQTGHTLASLDTRLCVAETATVLVITITVLLPTTPRIKAPETPIVAEGV
uniref:Slit homolog 1 protein-like n=1 Tax=Gouania willdenowi TaxID=441366 RepID=A0A8C5E948_GOUWI